MQFECKINDVIALGDQGGAGNLVICEVVKIHINEAILDANGMIDQYKIDLKLFEWELIGTVVLM